ncbi:zinc-dependent alcohol dehydrogenase [Microbacterium sp. C23T]
MSRQMRAASFLGAGRPLALTEVDRPIPGPGDALVKVCATGICRSDLHILEGHTPTAPPPLILGHEVSGMIAELPGGHPTLTVGQRVYIDPSIGCGDCRHCRAASANYCANRRTIGIHRDGGLAEYIVVPAGNLIPLPNHITHAEAAIIDSASVVEHALRLLDAAAGDTAVVIGAGGLGTQALRLALLRGVRVAVLDTDEVARQRCIDIGASAAVDPRDTKGIEGLIAANGVGGFDHAIDCVGSASTVRAALEMLGMHGQCAIVGIGDGALELTSPAHFVRRSLRVYGIYGSARCDIDRIVELMRKGLFSLEPSISARVSLTDVNRAIQVFEERIGSPVRVVVEP